ncbi:winged helix-turn-helix domain-containing protein [Enterobacter cancerogenus]|uniref:winged helix-turn-helix domain-containing protein n=1 Tax=Enterobacter cancerogenus TaxID=69218 RepID=UPI0030763EF3
MSIHNSYILDDRVQFLVKDSVLLDKKNEREIKLQRPASLCLQLLIHHQGSLVSQAELIDHGWGSERAKYITQNAFYQSMYHLRQSLAQVGMSDVIFTVARQGTGISGTIKIRYLLDGEVIESEIIKEKFTLPSATTVVNDIDFKQRLKWPKFILLLFIIIIISFILLQPHKNNDLLIKNEHQETLNMCRAYYSLAHFKQKNIGPLLQYAGIDCREKKTVFIYKSFIGGRISIISCSVYNEKKRNCQINYVMEPFYE